MLETLISSKTRIKLLLRLFLNPNTTAYLRGLAEEFNESTNSVRVELNRFEEADMLISENRGNKKYYSANKQHPLFHDINKMLLKYVGVDKVIEVVIERIGDLRSVYLTGDFAQGKDSEIIDLVFIGKIDKQYLVYMINRAEEMTNKKVRFIIYDVDEWNVERNINRGRDYLLLWENEKKKA